MCHDLRRRARGRIDSFGLPADCSRAGNVLRHVVEEQDFGSVECELALQCVVDLRLGLVQAQQVGNKVMLQSADRGKSDGLDPMLVVRVGEAGGRDAVAVERFHNRADACVFVNHPGLMDGHDFMRAVEAVENVADPASELLAADAAGLVAVDDVAAKRLGPHPLGVIAQRDARGGAALGPTAADADDHSAEVEADELDAVNRHRGDLIAADGAERPAPSATPAKRVLAPAH
jgi:hypothetical protein